ncbi:hypothetical protein [Melissospora conviva]|uniref:hypothetical protein n=1 Tax=Melissospora conviva TaxID=3388432 RepID=UPI003C1745F6
MEATTPGRSRGLLWIIALGATTVAAYLALFGWDQRKDLDVVTGNETGPYEAWQIIGLGLVVAALAFLAGRKHQVLSAVVALPLALTAAFAVIAVSSPEPGFWPIGALLLALGSAAATTLVAVIGRSTASHRPA